MDSNRIKNLATGVRDALRAEVSARLDAVLAEGSRERLEEAAAVRAVEADLKEHGRDEVVERAAYTWFNRLCALRFMDANGYTPTPVVTPREGQTQPAVLADAGQGVFDPEYEVAPEVRQRVVALLTGSAPSANAAEDAYALLLRAACVRYSAPMPYLFAEDVASSLLMPRGLLAQGSILARVVDGMDGQACSSVEVLGWLYQFYVAERKDEVFAGYKKRKKAQAADIAPATQLFTPEWIVRYLAQNSLGRLWMLNDPDSELAESMEYYIPPEGDEPHAEVASADEIRVLDPACGSGHILVYTFDLLFSMYEEEGWPTEDIPQMILENNLFGLEIDCRAAEIASFALEMKARERDPRWFDKGIDAHVRVLEPVELDAQELQLVPQLAERRALLDAMAHLDQIGSLYVPDGWDEFTLQKELEHVSNDGSLFAGSVVDKLSRMLETVRALGQTCHCVIANPPYMGSGNMNPWLSGWVKKNYPDVKSDLFATFIVRNCMFAVEYGKLGFMSPYVWMFISSYEKLRKFLIEDKTITSLIQLEYSGFAEATVPICTFTLSNNRSTGYKSGYVRLSDFVGAARQAPKALEAIHNPDCGWFYRADAEDFKAIPGWPIAYWVSQSMFNVFKTGVSLTKISSPKQGLATADNKRFLKLWWEPEFKTIGFGYSSREDAKTSGLKWFPCDKGGSFRKWYGNFDYVIDWENDGLRLFSFQNAVIRNPALYFKPYIAWSDVSSGTPSFRLRTVGLVFEHCANAVFCNGEKQLRLLSLLNSAPIEAVLKILSPTLHYGVGQACNIPILEEMWSDDGIMDPAGENVALSRTDWDAFETSWDFSFHPFLSTPPEEEPEVSSPSELSSEARLCERMRIPPAPPSGTLLSEEYARWETECRERFDQLKANEEEFNRIFARIYHMEGEVPIEVPDDKVSVRLADRARDARSLVSYAVGCLLGRYSDETPGLVLADQGQTVADFKAKVPHATFLPDEDNVLPVTADEWFDDDIVTGLRSWLAHAFGEATLEQNVAWLEASIGKGLRAYLCRDFYADHVRIYQKRPIYWMFSSPKRTFQCLVYMHRYDEGTVGTILTGYLRQMEDKLRARLQATDAPGASAADLREANKIRASIAELEAWERDVVYPLAHERVAIDLDDGVKVNYNKFPKALAKVSGLSEWR